MLHSSSLRDIILLFFCKIHTKSFTINSFHFSSPFKLILFNFMLVRGCLSLHHGRRSWQSEEKHAPGRLWRQVQFHSLMYILPSFTNTTYWPVYKIACCFAAETRLDSHPWFLWSFIDDLDVSLNIICFVWMINPTRMLRIVLHTSNMITLYF